MKPPPEKWRLAQYDDAPRDAFPQKEYTLADFQSGNDSHECCAIAKHVSKERAALRAECDELRGIIEQRAATGLIRLKRLSAALKELAESRSEYQSCLDVLDMSLGRESAALEELAERREEVAALRLGVVRTTDLWADALEELAEVKGLLVECLPYLYGTAWGSVSRLDLARRVRAVGGE